MRPFGIDSIVRAVSGHGRRLPRRHQATAAVGGLALGLELETRLALAQVPPGFDASVIASGLRSPTAMAFAPDGRLFVAEKEGRIRVIKDGALLETPFASFSVNSLGERGAIGLAIDPNFATNGYVYIYYTTAAGPIHNRLSRLTALGDVAAPGSETVLLDLPPIANFSTATNHNGGAVQFGPDGKIYLGIGELGQPALAQQLTNPFGKVLRINADGTIPADNPFLGQTSGVNQAIWALGLRNPFTMTFQPGTGRLFVNDVGQSTWEEVNVAQAGGNYGWPVVEGPGGGPTFIDPIYAYRHSDGCAIVGAAFHGQSASLPADYRGDYLFADLCAAEIRRFDPATGQTVDFVTALPPGLVDLDISPDGDLYYLAIGNGDRTGEVGRIRSTSVSPPPPPPPPVVNPPVARVSPVSQRVALGQRVVFTASFSGDAPLRIQWQRNGRDIPGAVGVSYVIPAARLSDRGAVFRAVATNVGGTAVSDSATLFVINNRLPNVTISRPIANQAWRPGQAIRFAATAHDPETGGLPASAFRWTVNVIRDGTIAETIASFGNVKAGSFRIPDDLQLPNAGTIGIRIALQVTDRAGLSRTVVRELRRVRLS